MKCEKTLLKSALLAFFLLFVSGLKGYAHMDLTPEARAYIDSTISVGFITCGPGTEVYSLYGHTALHFKDTERGTDVAVNWGMFSFSKPNFVARFVFGLTDYEIGIQDFNDFCEQYRYEQRWVKEQQLSLTPEEKLQIADAIEENYRPENREYRYNYFYDNCTTRARDMIVDHLSGKVTYAASPHEGLSFRQLIHQYCEGYPWVRFGNDMLLGLQADSKTTTKERQFLPQETMDDLDRVVIADGRRLVTGTTTLVDVPQIPVDGGFPLSPRSCALILLTVYVLLVFVLTLAPHGVLLSATGRLFPSPFSRALVPIVAFGVLLSSVTFGLASGRFRSAADVVAALSYGVSIAAPLFLLYVLIFQLYHSLRYVFRIGM